MSDSGKRWKKEGQKRGVKLKGREPQAGRAQKGKVGWGNS